MNATPVPQLVAKKTISIPHEPAAVMGFEGRNKIMGTDALILKREMTPTDGPFVGVPKDTLGLAGTAHSVFVLDEDRVLGLTARELADVAASHSFEDWQGRTITCDGFHGDDATVWDGSLITVET